MNNDILVRQKIKICLPRKEATLEEIKESLNPNLNSKVNSILIVTRRDLLRLITSNSKNVVKLKIQKSNHIESLSTVMISKYEKHYFI